MAVALTILLGSSTDPVRVRRQVAFHLAAGAELVLVAGLDDAADEALQPLRGDTRVERIEASSHTELARAAVERGADWVVPSHEDEFWWPRGESLGDVLAVVPARYEVVQALVRTFVDAGGGGPFFEDRVVRTSLLGRRAAAAAKPEELLRPVYRAEPGMSVDLADRTLGGRRVPLRAWYPIEVLRFPGVTPLAEDVLERSLVDGSLVEDTRLRDALRRLEGPGGTEPLHFSVPNVVDDASYAIECAALGEVDLEALDRHIRELELRIAALEARFWPSVRRQLRRIARRPG